MQSELERLRERIRELEVENERLRQSQQTLATEQETLQHVATQLINAYGMQSLYEQIVDTAVAITHSDFATIQMFYPKRGTSGELRLLCHRGFSSEAAKRWEWVRPETRTTCGEAFAHWSEGRRPGSSELRFHGGERRSGRTPQRGSPRSAIHAARFAIR
jgi:hypothetical protein